uniref:Long-chain-fatty-acid--CoA ligase n=1 Tax=Aplanochytrium stocchinoi TaxID=215587 RepID=A0A7S3PCP5_9STRA
MSIEVPNTFRPDLGLGSIRRNPVPYGPELSVDGMRTLLEVFYRSVQTFPNNPCVGWRPMDKAGNAGDYQWLTYEQTYERAVNFGCGLQYLQLCPPNEDNLRMLGFFAKNRLEWVVGEIGSYTQGVIPLPFYDTLGADSVEYVVNQTNVKDMVCTSLEMSTVVEVAKANPGSLVTVILMDGDFLSTEELQKIRDTGASAGLQVYTMGEVEKLGKEHPCPLFLPKGDDIAFFCYTSGTTGNPKGALIQHQGLLSSLQAIRRTGTDLEESDVHLSYLPLPHVFERGVMHSVFYGGGRVGFYQGDTLKILEDIQALRPTIFPSVPRLLNRVYDKIIAGVQEAGGIKQWLFEKALASKIAAMKNGSLKSTIWDTLVFGPLKKRIGFDRVRLMMTGSAPIADHVLNFLRAAFGVPVQEGYGQTESSLAITNTALDDFTVGHVGIPTPNCEVRLIDVPEMGYLCTDKNHNDLPCVGRGEVVFRGANVFAGYYKMPEKTADTIDEQGWVHTGDIGLWTMDGKLKIIDRKKNIFKLSQGEYVAAEKIENVVTRSPMIAMCFVYGDSLQSQLVAIVVPDEEYLAANNMDPRSGETKKALMDSLQSETAAAELKGFEIPKMIHVEPEVFSVDNGLLTPTFKLKRQQAKERYQTEIDNMYAQLNSKAKL